MRIVVGANHNGFPARLLVLQWLDQWGHATLDLGVFNDTPVDYPEIAAAVATTVSRGEVERGILLGWSAIGMTIVANKFPGIRAVPCHDDVTAELARRQNDANVLCLSVALLSRDLMQRIIETWLVTPFDRGPHAAFLEKIARRERAV